MNKNFRDTISFRKNHKAIPLLLLIIAMSLSSIAADFRIKPYVQNPATDAMTIIWFSNQATSGTLYWKKMGEDEQTTVSQPTLASELVYQESEISKLPGGIDPGAQPQGAAFFLAQFHAPRSRVSRSRWSSA